MAYTPTYGRGHMTRIDPVTGARVEDEDEYGVDPTNTAVPIQQRLQALLPKPDPEMDERWRAAENTALDRSAPEQYGAAEGIRDFAPMAVGSILDILVNKGRGLGTLAAGGMQALSAESSRRDAARTQAAKEAMGIRGQREEFGDRKTNALHALLRAEELGQRQTEQQAKYGDAAEQRATRDASLAQTQAETREILARANELEMWPGAKQWLEILKNGNQVDQAKAIVELKKLELNETKRKNDLTAEQQRLDRERQAGIDADKRAQTKTANKETFNRMGKDAIAQARVLAGIEPLLIKYGNKDRPGTGPLDSRTPTWMAWMTGQKPEDAARIKQGMGRLFGWASHEVTGATSPDKEREYNLIAQGLSPNATDAETTVGLNTARSTLRATIRGLASADEEAAKEVLREQGLYDFIYGDDVEYGKPPKRATGTRYLTPTDAADPRYNPNLPQPAPQSSPQDLPTRPTPTKPPPSAASPPPPALPPGEGSEFRALMGRIPPEQQQAVADRLAGLAPEERLPELRRLASGGRPAAAVPATEPPPPSAAPKRSKFDSRRRRGGTP